MNAPLIWVYAQVLKDVTGVRRLPALCQVGDWTHAEWFNRGDYPSVLKYFVPRKRPPIWNMLPKELDSPEDVVTVFVFESFEYELNGTRYIFYKRTQ